jgi:hypothetical protein
VTATATGMLTKASRSITTAVDLGASTTDVMLAAVVGLRRHDRPAGADRTDSRQLAALYPSLLGSGAEGEPSMFELFDDGPDEADDPTPDLSVGVPDDATSSSHEEEAGSTRGRTPPTTIRPKRHYPHRRAMTLRLGVERWRRLRQAAVDTDSNQTDVINAALDRHFAYLDSKKRRAAAS